MKMAGAGAPAILPSQPFGRDQSRPSRIRWAPRRISRAPSRMPSRAFAHALGGLDQLLVGDSLAARARSRAICSLAIGAVAEPRRPRFHPRARRAPCRRRRAPCRRRRAPSRRERAGAIAAARCASRDRRSRRDRRASDLGPGRVRPRRPRPRARTSRRDPLAILAAHASRISASASRSASSIARSISSGSTAARRRGDDLRDLRQHLGQRLVRRSARRRGRRRVGDIGGRRRRAARRRRARRRAGRAGALRRGGAAGAGGARGASGAAGPAASTSCIAATGAAMPMQAGSRQPVQAEPAGRSRSAPVEDRADPAAERAARGRDAVGRDQRGR